MSLTKQEFSSYIKKFQFKELFNEMGWNNDRTTQPIVVDNETYTLQAVGEKRGFKVLVCNPQANGVLPDYTIRKKIETKLTKLFQEHLLIFYDTKKTEQIWQLVVRQSGKPTKVTETRWHIDQDPELLYQRASGIFFELDEEDKITIIDVKNRVGENFQQNNEKVTKQFYDKFKKEHSSFLQFIKGISDIANREWYASLMLNRLMFCYFIQKKGFLDSNKNYLRDKLKACKEKKGKVKFYTFYRDFLLILFHKGLNEPTQSPETKIEIGKIPYLNGGLFDIHELEKTNSTIQIEDKAFEGLFNFFDEYEWHLDTRITASGKDINPDVIGYIFEKYINDRANMGAYYTKEDITDYISKNCILPFLFDETKRNYPKAFNLDGELWTRLKQTGDSYIYDAVKKGVEHPLPQDIQIGIDTTKPNLLERRKDWNKPATINFALPTEIWREVVERRNRYTDVKNKIEHGDVNSINDFITYNLNIRQFAQDTIENTNDPEFIKNFYQSLNNVTIIDPTCGSGAFLFAAMNILEPLYESCIQRMRGFTQDEDRANEADKTNFKNKYKYFREILENIQNPEHPNLQYFIYKTIILRNLYGVDIMKEAVEIAKLRLFLKLVATVEADTRKPNFGLEPLPDIDFNIRAGNTLVGFATEEELQNAFLGKLDFENDTEKIKEKCDMVARAFNHYKTIQLNGDASQRVDYKSAKDDLNNRLATLNQELNTLLCKEQGIDYNNPKSKKLYNEWFKQTQPFHWFAEFYEIINGNGGFDVIIGNPPYVEYSKVRETYTIKDYSTEKCGNLYAFVMERSLNVSEQNSFIGFIIPISITTTPRMDLINKLYEKGSYWISNFSVFPQSLFTDVHQRISITIAQPNGVKRIFTTKYNKWLGEERESLADNLRYGNSIKGYLKLNNKISDEISNSIANKIYNWKNSLLNLEVKSSPFCLFYKNTGINNWLVFSSFAPYCKINGVVTSSSRETHFFVEDKNKLALISILLNSNLFYVFYTFNTNCRDLNPSDIRNFNFPDQLLKIDFSKLFEKLNKNQKDNSKPLVRNQKQTGIVEIQSFRPRESKHIIDEIDTILAKHYGFTDEELDFIINYDIKYRMGKELAGDDEE